MSKRIFIAIDIEKNIQDQIYGYSLKTFSNIGTIRIIPPENLHITLKFIGKTGDNKIEDIKGIINSSVSSIGRFDLDLDNDIGGFPHKERARIAFIGTGSRSDGFKEVFDSLVLGLEKIGAIRAKGNFHPHLTIARIKKPMDISGMIRNSSLFWKSSIKITHVTLYESILAREGAKYIKIGRFGLK